MARRKCQICGNWIEDNNDSISYKKGYAHKKCFDVAMKVVVQEKKQKLKKTSASTPKQRKPELKDGLSEEEYHDKVALCDYLRDMTHEELTPKIYKLMEDYQKKYGINHVEMLADLKYFFEIKGNQPEGDVIGIIPYIHGEAQSYYKQLKMTQQQCADKIDKLADMYTEVHITMPQIPEKRIKQIDMNELVLNGDSEVNDS